MGGAIILPKYLYFAPGLPYNMGISSAQKTKKKKAHFCGRPSSRGKTK